MRQLRNVRDRHLLFARLRQLLEHGQQKRRLRQALHDGIEKACITQIGQTTHTRQTVQIWGGA